MDFQEVVRRRRMVRNFDDRPVSRHVVERILANGQQAPSAGFTQGTEFLVLEGAAEVNRFWEVSLPAERRARFPWPGLLRAPLLIVPFSNEQAYLDRYSESDKASPSRRSWGVPYWHVDAGFASMMMLLTAVDAGLGALFFSVVHPPAVRAEFGVPAGYEPVGALAIGHPAPGRLSSSASRRRRPPAEVVHRGRW